MIFLHETRTACCTDRGEQSYAWRAMRQPGRDPSVTAMIASLDRAGDHAVVLAVLVLIVAVAGLVYWLVQLAARRRAGRAHSDRRPGTTGRPDA
jgi:hypothetical protein